jgi:hypothetical protein
MFTVKVGNITEKFDNWEAAKAFAEKESYLQNCEAHIYSNQGMTTVKV